MELLAVIVLLALIVACVWERTGNMEAVQCDRVGTGDGSIWVAAICCFLLCFIVFVWIEAG